MLPLYKNKSVRDLAWSCFGPDLIDKFTPFNNADENIQTCHIALTSERLAWLEELDHNPQALNEALSTLKSQRLGLHHEALWHFFIQQDPHLELIAHNLAIHDKGKTIGEFDLLYYCHNTHQHYHLELAIKFYLDTGQFASTSYSNKNYHSTSRYLGPNCNDRLDIKLSHLIHRQALLSERACAKQHLEELNIKHVVKEVSIKGFIFYRRETNTTDNTLLSTSHAKAQWLTLEEFIQHTPTTNLWYAIEKPNWLGRAYTREDEGDQILKTEELIQALTTYFDSNNNKLPIMICSMKTLKENDHIEQTRYFITSNGWPNDKNNKWHK
jgi:hypothetical protein